jgi:hypothetical protein
VAVAAAESQRRGWGYSPGGLFDVRGTGLYAIYFFDSPTERGSGLGRPVIYTCEKTIWDKKATHFDTNHMLTIIWQVSDLKSAEYQLVAAIRATLRSEAIQTDG